MAEETEKSEKKPLGTLLPELQAAIERLGDTHATFCANIGTRDVTFQRGDDVVVLWVSQSRVLASERAELADWNFKLPEDAALGDARETLALYARGPGTANENPWVIGRLLVEAAGERKSANRSSKGFGRGTVPQGFWQGERPPQDEEPARAHAAPRVLVIGAGITGMSAAHELIERGFNVDVLEPETSGSRPNSAAVGGVARTPKVRLVAAPSEAYAARAGAPASALAGFRCTKPPLSLRSGTFDSRVEFKGNSPKLGDPEDIRTAFERLVKEGGERDANPTEAQAPRKREVRFVARITRDEDPTAAMKRAVAAIKAVERALNETSTNGKKSTLLEKLLFTPIVEPAREGWRRQDDDRHFIELQVMQYLVPSEHGFRVFPSFYRHMFDTMKRIPLYEDSGVESGWSAYDNLVPTGNVQMYNYPKVDEKSDAPRPSPVTIDRCQIQSFEELRRLFAQQRKLGYTNEDFARFQTRVLKYMTTGPARRKAKAESVTWLDYIKRDDFSDAFRAVLDDAPLALLAARADEIDARTHLNASVQIFLDYFHAARKVDMTLNAPTSDALLYPWKDYLRQQGVRFYIGELVKLESQAGALVPVFGPAGNAPHANSGPQSEYPYDHKWPAEHDYYVLAAPLDRVWDVMAGSNVTFDGEFAVLDRWRKAAEAEVTAEAPTRTAEDKRRFLGLGAVKKPDDTWKAVGPFRTMSGVQFLFSSGARVGGKGHVYIIGAPWAVCSISQPAYWRSRSVKDRHGYVSNLSVDVCNWYVKSGDVAPALDTTRDELAKEVWKQVTAPLPAFQRTHLDPPGWYTVDHYLDRGEDLKVTGNRAPYLINRVSDWPRRAPLDFGLAREEKGEEGSLPGRHYKVSHSNWVIAGPHMKTFTRITSMEAANESARHAVNAILYDVAVNGGTEAEPGPLMGEFCETWNPEDHELPDLNPLKALDDALFARGSPHIFDILNVELFLPATPGEAITRLSKEMEKRRADIPDALMGVVPGGDEVYKQLQALVEAASIWFKPAK